MIETLPVPLFFKDRSGKYLGCNGEFESFFGMPRSEIIGKTVHELFPKELADVYKAKDEELFNNPDTQSYEWKVLKKDGSVRQVIYNKAVFRNHTGEIDGLLGAVSDITELKKLTAELERSNEELARFAYVAAHDMKAPLGLIINSLQIIERDVRGKIQKNAEMFINHAIANADRMNKFILDLLDYSRITAEPRPLKLISGENLLKDALLNLEKNIKDANAEIEYGPLPEIKVDELRIVQLFQNLINNAIKFNGQNKPVIKISCQKDDNFYVFSIKDNGIGINSQDINKIFQMFARLHGYDEYPGNGIGLSVCKKIVENHGGKIWVNSEVGQGSNFFFTLPVLK